MSNINTNVKIIHSLRIHLELRKLGICPELEMKNPQSPNFNCWVYEATPELLSAFDLPAFYAPKVDLHK